MHKLASRRLALAITATLAVCGVGLLGSKADDKVYVDDDVSVSSAIERYIASNDDISAIEITEDITTEHTTTQALVSTDTDATATDVKPEVEKPVTDNNSGVKYPEYADKAVVVTDSNVNIRAAGSEDAEIVGLISSGGIMTVMDKGEEWSLIASGDVIGYICNDFIAFGDEGAEYAYNNVYQVAVVDTTTLRVRLEPSTESECVTLIPYGEKYRLLEHIDGWVYIEIDDMLSGYVNDEYIIIRPANIYARPIAEFIEPTVQEEPEDVQSDIDEDTYYQEEDAEENNDDYDDSDDSDDYSDDSNDYVDNDSDDYYEEPTTEAATQATTEAPQVGESENYSEKGVEIANFACQFLGNPYVYGGSSLTNGTDCSGFTMAVYANFGVSLPHGATMQSNSSPEVSISDLQPGDLVYYDHGTGSIEHVGLYIGGNQIVHASTETTGIIISSVNYSTPFKATRPLN